MYERIPAYFLHYSHFSASQILASTDAQHLNLKFNLLPHQWEMAAGKEAEIVEMENEWNSINFFYIHLFLFALPLIQFNITFLITWRTGKEFGLKLETFSMDDDRHLTMSTTTASRRAEESNEIFNYFTRFILLIDLNFIFKREKRRPARSTEERIVFWVESWSRMKATLITINSNRIVRN